MYTSPSERGDVEKPCPACGQVGSHGEYGVNCNNDRCRVMSYKEESRW
jgi:hypothetical protein